MGLRKQSGGGAAAAEEEFEDDPSYDLKQLFFYNIPTDKEISDSTNHIQYVPNHPINILYLLYLSVEMAIEDNIYDSNNVKSLQNFMKRIFNKFISEYADGTYKGKGPYKSKYYTSFAMGKYVYKFIRKLYAYSFEEDTQIDLSLLFSLLEYYFGCYISTLKLEGNYNDFSEITELISAAAPPKNDIDIFVDYLQTEMVCEWITRNILKEDFDITEIQEEKEITVTEDAHSLINPIEEGGLVSLLESIKSQQGHSEQLISALNAAIEAAEKERREKRHEEEEEEEEGDSVASRVTEVPVHELEKQLSNSITEDVNIFLNEYATKHASPERPIAHQGNGGSTSFSQARTVSVNERYHSQRYNMGNSPGGSQISYLPGSPPPGSPPRKVTIYKLIERILDQKTGTFPERLEQLKTSIQKIKRETAAGGGGAGGGGGHHMSARKTRRKRRGLSNKSRRYRFF
jgi:hypothetical protein